MAIAKGSYAVPTSLTEAKQMMQPFIDQAREILESHEDGYLQPVFFVFTRDRGVDIKMFGWDSEREKNLAAAEMRMLAYLAGVFGLWGTLLITDARYWEIDAKAIAEARGCSLDEAIRLVKEEPDQVKKHCKPIDCLLVQVETYFGDVFMNMPYHREGDPKTGRVVWHPYDPQYDAATCVESRFGKILPALPAANGASA